MSTGKRMSQGDPGLMFAGVANLAARPGIPGRAFTWRADGGSLGSHELWLAW